MRALIVDDEAPARRKMRRLLAAEPDVDVVGEAANGREGIDAIRQLAPDVVFLDIQMPQIDGFGVIEAVGLDAMPRVVFVTAYDQHAVRAFEAQALDYVLKPVAADRLRASVARLRRELRAGTAAVATRLAELVETLKPARYLQRLLVERDERGILLPVDRIDRLEADRNYVRVFAAGAEYLLRTPLGALEERLDPARFLRVNRSAIVRLDAIKELQPWFHGDRRIVLRDGTQVMWSRRYRTRAEGQFTP